MMKLKPFRFFVIIAFAWYYLPSCSVKEDRTPCPSHLTVSTEYLTDRYSTYQMHVWDVDEYHLAESFCPEYLIDGWSKQVPKGVNLLACILGLDNGILERQSIRIPLGKQSDRLYTYCSYVDCRSEFSSDTVFVNKQFCVIDMDLGGYVNRDDVGNPVGPAVVFVQASCNAYDLVEHSAVPGSFAAEADMISESLYRIRLPRQNSDSRIRLYITMIDGHSSEIDVARLLTLVRYDWSKPSLDDVKIEILDMDSKFKVNIIDWEEGNTLSPVM